MTTLRLRDRCLAALGLSSGVLAACHTGDLGTSPDVTATATADVSLTAQPVDSNAPIATATPTHVTTSTGAATVASVSSWVPKDPPVPMSSVVTAPPIIMNRPTCPSGKFCVPEANAVGSPAAEAPFGKCATALAFPQAEGRKDQRDVRFDKKQTAWERGTTSDACCYSWSIPCPGGRPLIVDGAARTAPEAAHAEWIAEGGVDLGATDERLAEHYATEARFEHASVASFARVSLSLLALGAPADLLAATHRAALDEIEHARAMFAVASAHRGAPVGPGPLDLSGTVLGAVSLEELAREAFWEGCVGEVAAALVLREEAALAKTGTLRDLLTKMADDEERHAELAFRTVSWALSRDAGAVRAVLLAAQAEIERELAAASVHMSPSSERELVGVTSHAERAAIRARALREVVAPCLAALLHAQPAQRLPGSASFLDSQS